MSFRTKLASGALLMAVPLAGSTALAQPTPQPPPNAPAEPTTGEPAAAPPSAPTAPEASSPPAPATWGGPAPAGPAPTNLEPHPPLPPDAKRAPQDFDGREDRTTTAEDALWVPRVALFPLYLLSEYVIRWPLGTLVKFLESNGVISDIMRSQSDVGVLPTAFIDFGFRPSIGLYFFWDNFLTKGNDLRATVAFGGPKFWRGGIADRIPFDTPVGTERARSYFQTEANFLTRGDLLFWGIGPDTFDDNESNYGIFTVGAGARIHVEPWRGNFMEAWFTGRYTTTSDGDCGSQTSVVDGGGIVRICDPPTVRRRILDGTFEPPPSYGRPYATVKSGVRFVLDSRKPRPVPGHGVAFDGSLEHVADLDQPNVGGWLNWGGALAGFVDLTETQRVLSLTVAAKFQDTFKDTTVVPFTELVGAKHIEDVPDYDLMRGFKPGRLLGSSLLAATLEYRWPLWAFLDGTMQATVGSTFLEPHLEDIALEKMRFSFIGGFRSPNHRDHSFNLLFGFGTDTFEEGGNPSSVRFVFGGTTGF